MILALYDFRSKQNFIYSTNKIKEISGGSLLISRQYGDFIAEAKNNGINILNDMEKPFKLEEFKCSDLNGQVLYEGGGNLFVIYKDRETFVKANKIFSRMVIKNAYDLSLLASGVEVTGVFADDRSKLYLENSRKKNTGFVSRPCNVLPFTQVDPNTFLPVTTKEKGKSLSTESKKKLDAYNQSLQNKTDGNSIKDIGKIASNEGKDSLIAIIYTDGNKIGDRLKNLTSPTDSYDTCVKKLREFSAKINTVYVKNPIAAIDKALENHKYPYYRQIIGGGDEITIICNARAAADVVKAYYEALDSEKSAYYACTGIAICHEKTPFSEAYKIAEACCESAKKKCRNYDSKANCVDFHYCHSGILGDFDDIRNSQEQKFTLRPYTVEDYTEKYLNNPVVVGKSPINRSDIKTLGQAIVKSDIAYGIELERLKAKYRCIDNDISYTDNNFKKLVFDTYCMYDLWFSGSVKKDAGEEANK